ncbi:MAG: Sapep family Mn(2+)-dependent dipeptidase, partial [Thermoanaerobaculia bacterium]
DVADVQGQQWSSPPWEAKIVNGRMIGRGTEDDKGPIVAALYGMAALRDSGWPLGSTLRLLVANGEETSWEEIPYYFARAPMPERTIGLDGVYPVTHAQKGYGVLTFRAEPVAQPRPGKWRVVRISGGSGLSIIAERGEALLEPIAEKESKDDALGELSRRAAEWAQAHPPAKLTVSREGDLLKVTTEGRGGHSSEPASGHNALGDLTAFLATLEPRMDAWGALASFVGVAVGTETDGRSLGIQHVNPAMGALTCNLSFLLEENGAPIARLNIRPPRGIAREQIEKSLAERTAAFLRRTGAPITAETDLSTEAHYVPPEGELVASLLAVWEEVTGAPGRPVAIGGATQARFFKGGVDFGPALPGEEYRAHGPDEYLTAEELHRIAELTIAAVWRLARSTS